MNMNVISLRIQANNRFVEIYAVNTAMIKKAERTGKAYYANPNGVYFRYPEIEHVIKCLRGEADFYPFMDDGINLARFSKWGFRVIHLSSYCRMDNEVPLYHGQYEDLYFYIPGYYVANLLYQAMAEGALRDIDNGDEPFIINADPKQLYFLKCKHAPKIKLFVEDDVKTALIRDLKDERQTQLFQGLRHLTRIARNNSWGDRITLSIYFEGRPKEGSLSSYYWVITNNENKRLINGGLIAHDRSTPSESKFEYSLHT